MASFGDWLAGTGHALGLPNLGISYALDPTGKSTLPGILQGGSAYGVNPNDPHYLHNVYPAGVSPTQALADIQSQPQMPAVQGSPQGVDPNLDPNAVAAARVQDQGLMGQLNDLYNAINGNIDTYAQDQKGLIDQNYATQFANNDNAYKTAVDKTNGYFGADGAADSSYRGNALDLARTDYNNSNNALTQARDANYAQLGGVVASNKAAIANRPNIDLSAYTDVPSLLSLRDQLNTHIQGLQGVQRSLFTQGQLKDQLAKVTPAQSDLPATLKSRIDSLTNSGASPDAMLALGSGYISRSGLPKDQQDALTKYLMGALTPKAA